MIRIMSVQEAKADCSGEVWAIVRSMKRQTPGVKQVAGLSPDGELFHRYLALRDAGKWNADSFAHIYVPAFLQQMREDEPRGLLNALWQRDRAGETITLACFCPDETLCHRSIVAGLLQGAGCNVATATGADYAKYYEMFRRST